jgi:hypothetical protein
MVMSQETKSNARLRNQRMLGPFCANIGLGVIFLSIALNKPRIAELHGSDIVLLLGVGALFGSAITALGVYFVGLPLNRSRGGTPSEADSVVELSQTPSSAQ